MNRSTRNVAVSAICLAMAACVSMAAPATAAKAGKITAASCAAQGGTYSETKNTRSCQVSYIEEVGQPAEIVFGPDEPLEGTSIVGNYYQVWLVWANYQVVQTCTQKGGKAPTCQTTRTYLNTSKMRGICQFRWVDQDGQHDAAADGQDCIDRGLLPTLGSDVVLV